MDLQLSGKTALVTGSTAGIGFAIAKTLAAEGAAVVVNGRKDDRVGEAVAEIRRAYPNAPVTGIAADLSSAEGVETLTNSHPDVDILINNVGFFEMHPFTEIPDEEWHKVFDLNVMSGVRLSRAYLPKMKERNWGRIIFISSESALNIPEEMVHYGVTKVAQLGLSRGVAEYTKGTGVTVNSVLPGPTKSEAVGGWLEDMVKQGKAKDVEEAGRKFVQENRPASLIQRAADVAEVADVVVFVASPRASVINGTSIRADGGVVKHIL
ncbi:MAG: short-chain dehydrogenase/reductase family protein [Puniceicoccaceae bacterium 5H]|nr:MAG: short-chain dehydrogenase/reductase family protein [Puniceicoccaceae bacterium 5H]